MSYPNRQTILSHARNQLNSIQNKDYDGKRTSALELMKYIEKECVELSQYTPSEQKYKTFIDENPEIKDIHDQAALIFQTHYKVY